MAECSLNMIRFSHNAPNCKSEVVRYVGVAPLISGLRMRQNDWQRPDGSAINGLPIPCADCGKIIFPAIKVLSVMK